MEIHKHLISDCQPLRTSKTEKIIEDLLKLYPFAPKPPSRMWVTYGKSHSRLCWCPHFSSATILKQKINRRTFHKLADTVDEVLKADLHHLVITKGTALHFKKNCKTSWCIFLLIGNVLVSFDYFVFCHKHSNLPKVLPNNPENLGAAAANTFQQKANLQS